MKTLRIPCRYRRFLRVYRHIAHVNHGTCLICNLPIEVGQQYEGEVFLTETGISVDKRHHICPDDFWLEEEEKARSLDEEIKAEESGTSALAAA